MHKRHCCFEGCPNLAMYALYGPKGEEKPETETDACEGHMLAMPVKAGAYAAHLITEDGETADTPTIEFDMDLE